MNIVAKVGISIVLFIAGFLCLGALPYFPGRILVSIGLFSIAMISIGAIWKKQKNEGEGDVFKDTSVFSKSGVNDTNRGNINLNAPSIVGKNENINKDNFNKIDLSYKGTDAKKVDNDFENEKKKVNELFNAGVFTKVELEAKLELIDLKIRERNEEIKREKDRIEWNKSNMEEILKEKNDLLIFKQNLDSLKSSGVLSEDEYSEKLEIINERAKDLRIRESVYDDWVCINNHQNKSSNTLECWICKAPRLDIPYLH